MHELIFDVDGVLVDSPHESAWGETVLDLAQNVWKVEPQVPYDTALYQAEVAGRPRHEGAARLLHSLGITDPDGSRMRQLADEKQRRIVELIEAGKFRAFPDAVRLLLRAKALGAKAAAASSSKNANAMLSAVVVRNVVGIDAPEGHLIGQFDANVCGRDFELGKPHPAIFLAAAQELGCEPRNCVVVEDAPSGVAAAKAGGMRCVGIARLGDEDLLRAAGADWVVDNLDRLQLGPDGLPEI